MSSVEYVSAAAARSGASAGILCTDDSGTPAGVSHRRSARPKLDSGSEAGTARSSAQKKWALLHETGSCDSVESTASPPIRPPALWKRTRGGDSLRCRHAHLVGKTCHDRI